MVETSPEILGAALKAVVQAYARHRETRHSLKSCLYEIIREKKYPTKSVEIARRMIWEHGTKRNLLAKVVNKVLKDEPFLPDKRILLELFADQVIVKGCNRLEAAKFAQAARIAFGKDWMAPLEPLLGRLYALKLEDRMIESKDELEHVSLIYGHPKWFVEYVFNVLGKAEAIELMRASNEKPPTYFVLNRLKATDEEIFRILENDGVEFERDKRAPLLYRLISSKAIKDLAAYKRGLIAVQDFSSVFAVISAQPKSGMKLLDICAAPGIKTSLFAIYTQNKARILSIDLSPHRLKTYVSYTRRLGVESADAVLCDATRNLPTNLSADIVMLDPPCSSTGLFWREPSYRWVVKPNTIKKFSIVQKKMLNNAAKYVKHNGLLIYCTCSITLEENEGLIKEFLNSNPNFQLEEIPTKSGSPGLLGLERCRRFYPHRDMCNGFFVAHLRKVS
ncbi:MAG: RsmB/NOP family class I SAM-dependent RNA methyltransferase [Nitrososphaerota archaeon]|nr:RsmB/NOP family class I SAM-dependent RNA methyltransferase [Nitrososphaerota archaeon]